LLHRGDERPKSRDTRELEAEAVAFVIGHVLGLDVTDSAPPVASSMATAE